MAETTAALLEADCEVDVAHDGEAALAALRRQRFDVLCTDFNMPGYNGLELLRMARKLSPELGCVLVTGYREYAERTDREKREQYYLLVKPYQPAQLIDLVARAGKAAVLKRQLTAISLDRKAQAT